MKYSIIVILFLFSNCQLFSQINPVQLTSSVKSEVVESLSKSLIKNYISVDTSMKMANYINKRFKDGVYNNITNPREFSQQLTTDLRSIYDDKHLSIIFDPQMQENLTNTSKSKEGEKRKQNLVAYGQENFGFKKVEILGGNIGYIYFDRFFGFNDVAKETVNSAFSFLKYANTLIIDVRNNGGGSPDMDKYISSFLLQPKTQLSSFYERRNNSMELNYTYQPDILVSFASKPIYILVNRRTFSAAEAFAYDLQSLHRATIIGETTGGGANAVEPTNISNGFFGLIPFSKAINPVTGINWEAVGVKPDIQTNADSSIDAAVLSYYDYQITNSKEPNEIKKITWVRDMLQTKLHPIHLDTILLANYIGNFADRKVSLENGNLYYTGKDNKKVKLVPMTPAIFKFNDLENVKIEFIKNSSGQVNEMNFIFDDGYIANYKRKE